MLTLTDAQKKKAYSATPQSVTLVRIETYTDHAAKTVDEVLYFATLPLLYRWDGATVNHWRGFVESVGPLARGFSHIPTDAELSTRDGLRVNFAADDWGTLNVWWLLTQANLVGAKIEVATLLLDWRDSSDGSWIDQSATTADHIVRFRGEVTQVPQYAAEATTFELVADSVEPPLDFGQALDELEVSEKDLGKLYPIPIGSAKQVELIQREVGWVTTIASAITATTTGLVYVADARGFAASPTVLNLWIGTEKITATKFDDRLITITARGQTTGGVTTTALEHTAGSVIVEEIPIARFVYAGHPTLGVSNVFARSPHTGHLILIIDGAYSVAIGEPQKDAGRRLGVISFTAQQWATVIRLINNEAKITAQPTASTAGVDTLLLPFGSYGGVASVTSAVNSSFSQNLLGVTDTHVVIDYHSTGSNKEAAVFWSNSGAVPNQARVVSRFRVVWKYRIESNGLNTTLVKAEFLLFGVTVSSHLVATLAPGPSVAYQTTASAWQTPAPGTTMAGMINTATTVPTSGQRALLYLDQTAGGSGSSTAVAVSKDSIVEVELVPLEPVLTPTDTTGAQEIGFNLDLFADVSGVVTLGTEVVRTEFDDSTGWIGTNCAVSNEAGTGFRLTSLATPNPINRSAKLSGISPALDLQVNVLRFELYIETATYDALVNDNGGLRVTLTSTAGNLVVYGWSKATYKVNDWNDFTIDVLGAGSQFQGFTGSLNVASVTELTIQWDVLATGFGGFVSFRNLRVQPRGFPTHPIDVAQWLIEDNVGLVADPTTFATAKTNLPSVVIAGDLRNAGATFGDVLARIGLECRTNFITSEGASSSSVKAYNALTSFAFSAAVRSLGTSYRGLITRSRQLDERTTDFMAVYDFRNDVENTDLEGYRALIQANASTNDISARVATATITAQQALVGVRPTDPMPFLLIPNLASAIEVWSYYVAETLRGNGKRFTLRTDYRFGYDIEVGDVLDFVPPWQAGVIKCRVLEVLFPFDAPAIDLTLEEVL